MPDFPFRSLRAFLQHLETHDRLVENEVEVDLRGEVSAIAQRIASTGGPAALHERIQGYPGWRVVTDLLTTRERQAWALGVPREGIVERVSTFLAGRELVKPRIVDDGPCKELKFIRDEVDLTGLPLAYIGQLDSPPYITAGISNVIDPDSGWQNTGIRRFQLKGVRKLNHCLVPFQQEGGIYLKYCQRKEPMPIAIVIGADPLYYLVSQMPVPPQVDEMDYWGAFTREPMEVVRCETSDILVPATAEIVIEGVVDPAARELEGPCSEFSGFYSGVRMFPVIHVSAVTMRKDAIYYHIYNGLDPSEGGLVGYMMVEIELHRQVRALVPELRDVRILAAWGLVIAISIDKAARAAKPGLAKKVALALKMVPAGKHVKNVIVVDDDVDLRSTEQILWAMGVKFQAAKDLTVVSGVPGCVLDPSELWLGMGEGFTSLSILDCTEKPAPYNETYKRGLSVPAPAVAAKVDANWARYGFAS